MTSRDQRSADKCPVCGAAAFDGVCRSCGHDERPGDPVDDFPMVQPVLGYYLHDLTEAAANDQP